MQKLVLFDIDGTLLWSDGAGRAAIREALLAEMGATGPVQRFRFDGKTDPQIVRELLTAAGHPQAASESHIGMVCARYVELLDVELRSGTREIRVFAGVEALLDEIEIRPAALLGLLTGNVAQGASLKLQAAGIEPTRFRVGAFGSDSADRSALPAIAVRRAETLMGRRPSGQDIVIIGDTPADMTCGRSLGARAIGVATGAYAVGDLIDSGAYVAFEDLSNTAGVLAAIGA